MQTRNFIVNNHSYTVHLRDEADQSVAAEIFKLHEYRIVEPHLVQTTEAIVDGGAHSGLFTLYTRAFNPAAPIIAIEPEENNLKLLQQHLAENTITGVEIIAGALAEKYGKKKLLLSKDSHNHHLVRYEEGLKNEPTQIVQGYDFNHLLKRCPNRKIGLLKLDIEGGEYEVFSSLTAEDLASVRAIIMEYHDLEFDKHGIVEQQLREQGFGVQIFPSKFDKTMGFMWAINKRAR